MTLKACGGLRCAALFAWLIVGSAGPACAADNLNFADKTVTMTIGFAAGGGVDLYGRTVGKYLARNLPGAPSLVVMNQPGAGGVVALNEWSRKADANGLTLTVGAQSQTDPDALIRTRARFDPSTFRMIGGLSAYSQGLFIRTDALDRLNDKSKPPVVMGMVGSTLRGGTYQVLWGSMFLGWNVKWVLGYASTAEARQALERGEIEMATFGATKDFEYVSAIGKFSVLSQTGQTQDGRRVARPTLGSAPIFSELVRDRITDPQARRLFSYWEDVSQIGMWVALPASAADNVIDAYRKSFEATVTDSSYREEYARIDPDSIIATRTELESLVKRLASVSPETLKFLDTVLTQQGFTPGQ